MWNFRYLNSIVLFILILHGSSACRDEQIEIGNCDESIFCDQIFLTISIKITDEYDNPVALDEYYSVHVAKYKKYNFQII